MTAKPLPNRRRLVWRGLLSAGLLLAVLAGLHAVLWRWTASELETQFGLWAGLRRAQGWQVAHGAPERGGWPNAVTLRLPGFHLAGGERSLPGGLAWQAEAVVLRVDPLAPSRLVAEALGQQRLRLQAIDLPYTAGRLTLTVPIEDAPLPREALLLAERLRLDTATGLVEVQHFRLQAETNATAGEGEPALTLAGSAFQLALPAGLLAPPAEATLGRQLQEVALRAMVNGPVPAGQAPAQRARRWREGGGTLALQALDLRWGAVSAHGEANLALDPVLQPEGAGTLRLRGAEQALAVAGAAGLIPPRNLGAVQTVVRLMQRPGEDGQPVLQVPLTLENRNLGVARMTLLRLPPLTWAD